MNRRHVVSLVVLIALASAGVVIAQKARVQRTVWSDATQTTGTGDAVALAPSPALTALTDLDTVPPTHVCWVQEAANTTTVTLAISGLTAKPVYKMNGAITTALAANDLRVGQTVCVVRYPTGDAFQMITQIGNAPGGGSSAWEFPFIASVDGASILSARLPMISVTTGTGSAQIGSGANAINTLSLPLAGTGAFGVHITLDSRFVTNGAVSVELDALTAAAETITWNFSFGCMSNGMANSIPISLNTASTPAIANSNNVWTHITATGIVATGCAARQRAVLRIAHAASTNDVYVAGGIMYQ